MARVSVIIPTFNRPNLLPRAVESALRAGSQVEVIVVDDASCDETAGICQTLRNISYVRLDSNRGVAGARNAGLLASTSEFVSFLDDDDLRLPRSIDVQLNLLAGRPEAGMIYGQALYGNERCEPKGGLYPHECPQGDIFWQVMQWNFIPCPTVIFRRACLERVGLLDESASGVDDWDLWVRIAELYLVLSTERPVAVWRQPTPTSDQFSFQARTMYRRARRLLQDKWLRLPRSMAAQREDRVNAARCFADRATQNMFWEAVSRYKSGLRVESLRLACEMARLYPRTVIGNAMRGGSRSLDAG